MFSELLTKTFLGLIASTIYKAKETMEWSTFPQLFESSAMKVSLQDAIQKPPKNNSSPKQNKTTIDFLAGIFAEPGPAGIFPDETVADVFSSRKFIRNA